MEIQNSNSPAFNRPLVQQEDSIDFKRHLSLFISNWYWFAIFLFISLTVAYGINRYSEQILNVSSSMLIEDEVKSGFAGMDPIFPGMNAYKNQQSLSNEIGILKSFELNRTVIDSLAEFNVIYIMVGRRGIAESRQYKSMPFIVIPDTANRTRPLGNFSIALLDSGRFEIGIKGVPESDITRNLGDTIRAEDFSPGSGDAYRFVVNKRDDLSKVPDRVFSNNYYFTFPDPDALAVEYRNKLRVAPIDENSTMVILSVTGKVAEQEIDYLNKLMDLYINRGLGEKNKTAELTIDFINEQLSSIHDSLTIAEDSLQQFRLKNKLINISNEGSTIKARLERFETDRFDLDLQRKYFAYLKEYVDSKEETADVVSPSIMGINDPLLERLLGDLSVLQQQRLQLTLNLSTELAVVGMLDERIQTIKTAINENVRNSLANIVNSLADVNIRIREVERELEKLPETEKGLIRIQRRFDLNSTVYNYLLEKRAEAGIALASNVADNKKIDHAGKHSIVVIKPKPSKNNLIALMLGIVLPALAIFLIDYFNNRVIDKRDVERGTTVPVLGYISHNEYKTETPVLLKPGSTLAESFRAVRTALKYYSSNLKSPVIAISSTVSAEGKTFTTVNLAIITAMLGKKVLIMGMDLRKPKVHKLLDSENISGMSNFLSGQINFDEVIQATKVENLWYAPSGPVPPNPAELIETGLMKDFIDEARKKFDYIFIDTPPVAIVTDVLMISPYVDINLFVVRQRYTSKNTLGLIQDLYESGKLKNLSIIINDISLTGYYGYGLRYGYSIRYGGYSYGYSLYGDYVYSRYGYGKNNKDYYTDNG